ncbi:MAG: hypothetical protein F6J95_023895 [Leptolyngbya sp. SIO1E4]|nr:hypothetical protein [Leptolyngbya sp. SIO1E4]
MPRKKGQQGPTIRSQIAGALRSPKAQAVIRARCQNFGPQSALSLARSLGFNTTRPVKGGYTLDTALLKTFEEELDLLDLGMEKVPSRDDPQKSAYRIAVEEVA